MSAGKIIGGIIGILGAFFILMFALTRIPIIFAPPLDYSLISGWIWNMLIGVLGIVGSILAFMTKKASGFLLLAAGLLSIVLGVIFAISDYTMFETWQYSYFASWGIIQPYENLFFGISLEAIIVTLGGVICLASSSD